MWVMMNVKFVWEKKDVVLDFPSDGSVPADDVSKGRCFQSFDKKMWKDIEVKKPVAVPQSFKLIYEDGIK